MGGVLPPPKCSLNYSLERHGMERVRGKWSHEAARERRTSVARGGGREKKNERRIQKLRRFRSLAISLISLSLHLRELIFGQPTESRMEWKVSSRKFPRLEIRWTDNTCVRLRNFVENIGETSRNSDEGKGCDRRLEDREIRKN